MERRSNKRGIRILNMSRQFPVISSINKKLQNVSEYNGTLGKYEHKRCASTTKTRLMLLPKGISKQSLEKRIEIL